MDNSFWSIESGSSYYNSDESISLDSADGNYYLRMCGGQNMEAADNSIWSIESGSSYYSSNDLDTAHASLCANRICSSYASTESMDTQTCKSDIPNFNLNFFSDDESDYDESDFDEELNLHVSLNSEEEIMDLIDSVIEERSSFFHFYCRVVCCHYYCQYISECFCSF